MKPRHLLALLLALLMTALPVWTAAAESLITMAPATDEVTGQRLEQGMDIVILLDMTASMTESNYGAHDRLNNRLDAAVMMINMCDMANTRVAVVPYSSGDRLYTGSLMNTFIDMSDDYTRTALCDAIIAAGSDKTHSSFGSKTKERNASNETWFAAAYEQALALVQTSNPNARKVVVMLTDGDHSDREDTFGVIRNSLNAAVDSVYGILLNTGSADAAANQVRALAYPSAQDHYFKCTSDNIVEIFSTIFAQEIGSEKRTINPTIDESNTVTLNIEIPNNSIAETNIEIPAGLIANGGTVVITDFSGKQYSQSSDNVLVYEKRVAKGKPENQYDFVSVKLKNPKAGNWSISFPGQDKVDATEFSCDLLYNYEVQLVGMTNIQGTVSLVDVLEITAWFVERDGSATTDMMLYRDYDASTKGGMQAWITIYADNGSVAVDNELMTNNTTDGNFCYSIDLDTVRDVTPWKECGTYTAVIHVEGDSLKRDLNEPILFNIGNQAPVLVEGLPAAVVGPIEIQKPEENAVAGTVTIDVSSYFADLDNDALTYTVTSGAENGSVDANGMVTLNVPAAIEGTSATYTVGVTVTDVKEKASPELTVTLNVISVTNTLASILATDEAGYTPAATVDVAFIREDTTADKGATATVTATIVPNEDLAILNPDLAAYLQPADLAAGVAVAISANGEIVEPAVDENGVLSYTYTFGAVEDSVTFDVAACFAMAGVVDEPVAVECSATTHTVSSVNKVPFDNGKNEADGALTVKLDDEQTITLVPSDYIDDDDLPANDTLTYNVCWSYEDTNPGWKAPALGILRAIGLAGKETRTEIDFTEAEYTKAEDESYTLDLNATGVYTVSMVGTDLDESTANLSVTVNTESGKETLFCIILYVIILIIIAIIIAILYNRFVTHRPWPSRADTMVTAWVDGVEQYNGGETVWTLGRRGRNKYKMGEVLYRFGDNPDYEQKVKEPLNKLTMWTTTKKEIVVEGKVPDSIRALTVGTTDLKRKKKAKWKPGTSIEVTMNVDGSETTLKWTRVSASAASASSDDFSGGYSNYSGGNGGF